MPANPGVAIGVERAFGAAKRGASVWGRIRASAAIECLRHADELRVGSGAALTEAKIAAGTTRPAQKPKLASASPPPRGLAFAAMGRRVAEET